MKQRETSDIELLLACSTPRFSDSAGTRIRALAAEVTDWPAVRDLAASCRAAPLLYARLLASGVSNVPGLVWDGLRKAQLANTARTARLTHSLADILEALDSAGIPALTFKGPVLAQEAYDDPSLRQFDDLDINVAKRDLRLAKQVIEGRGYKAVLGLPERLEASAFRPSRPHVLRHHDGSHDVDLSCRIMHDYFSCRFPREVVWGRSRLITLDGRTVRTISREAQFLHLCLHGSKHRWSRPVWMGDIAGLLFKQAETTDWEEVRRLARSMDGTRMLHLAVGLAQWAHGAPVPELLTAGMQTDPALVALMAEVRGRFLTHAGQPDTDDFDRLRFHLRLRQRLRSRLRYVLLRGVTPSYNDWRTLSLPGFLFPLYYLTRPFRLAIHTIRRGVRVSCQPGTTGRPCG